MAHLSLKLMGSYRLSMDGLPFDNIGSVKARALLAYLAIERDHPHPREKLVGLLWPEHDEAHARGSLSQTLYQLRGILGDRVLKGGLPPDTVKQTHEPCLLVTTQEIRLNPQCVFETDVAVFSGLVTTCKTHTHPQHKSCEECLEHFQEAARLYTGDFLDGFYLPKSLAFDEWATILREQLRLEVMEVLENLVLTFEQQGELEQALAYARRMVVLDELGEAGNAHLMHLLALLGKREEALAQYISFRQVLAIQVGAETGNEIRLLYQHLRNEQAGTEMGSLPANLTPFIGRKSELNELWGWLSDPGSRLICILGPGGCGKTRLALEAARRQRYHFGDGVYFVSLSALGSGSSLLAVIAERLSFTFREIGDHKRQLLDYLRNKKVLLVLDSFETVVESAGLVAELLSASEGSKVLVTSRVRLNLSGEHIYPLEGMSFPPKDTKGQMLDYSSVELFMEATRQVKTGYQPIDLPEVGRICRLVEGMPLSVLLASSWVTNYSIQEIAEQIERSLDFLSVEWADLPERQRSLRATFEYSFDLLSPSEQQVLMKLSVFRNPFNAQTAFDVAGTSPQVLHALVGMSLLGSTAEGQYHMHDLVRQYSQEKLTLAADGLEKAARQRHSEYFLGMAAGWSSYFKGSRQITMLAQADKQIDDVRAAWDWACQQAVNARLNNGLEGLCLYYDLSSRFKEGQGACQGAADQLAGVDTLQACSLLVDLRIWQSRFSRLLGELELAHRKWEEAEKLARRLESLGGDARSLQAFIWLEAGEAILTADLKAAHEHLQRSVELYRQVSDPWRLAAALVDLGINLQHSGNYAEATEPLMECIAMRRDIGDQRGLAYALTWLAFNFSRIGSLEKCESLMRESMAINQSIGDKASMADGLMRMGRLMVWQGKFEESFGLLEQSLPLYRDLGDRYNLTFAYTLITLGRMLAGEYEQVKEFAQMQMKLAQENGLGRELASSNFLLGCAALAEGEIQEAHDLVQESVNLIRQVGHQDELGWTLAVLANILYTLGMSQLAHIALVEALQISVKTRAHQAIMFALAAMVSILAREGQTVQAVEIYALVLEDPIWKVSPWIEKVVGQYVTAASASLPEEVVEAARQRGRQRDHLATVQEMLEECTFKLGTSTS
jgi:predicted ATPase/DNA-binding SARP family transcriptional activator